jgi:hypothetical protein
MSPVKSVTNKEGLIQLGSWGVLWEHRRMCPGNRIPMAFQGLSTSYKSNLIIYLLSLPGVSQDCTLNPLHVVATSTYRPECSAESERESYSVTPETTSKIIFRPIPLLQVSRPRASIDAPLSVTSPRRHYQPYSTSAPSSSSQYPLPMSSAEAVGQSDEDLRNQKPQSPPAWKPKDPHAVTQGAVASSSFFPLGYREGFSQWVL